MSILPATNSAHCTAVIVAAGYLDSCGANLLQCLRPSSSYSADFGLHDINCVTQYNSGDDGWNWFCQSTGNNFWSGIQLGHMLQTAKAGVNIGLGQKLFFKPGWTIETPSYVTANQPGMLFNNTTSEIWVSSGVVAKATSPNTPNAGLQFTANVDKFRVDLIRAPGCATAIADSSTTSNKSITSALAW
jgi:hypothetical protein